MVRLSRESLDKGEVSLEFHSKLIQFYSCISGWVLNSHTSFIAYSQPLIPTVHDI